MKSVRWNLRGGEFDLREAARAAARRSGMSLGEWLDEAVAERAARLRLDPEDLEDADRIEAIAERLGALTLDEADAPPRSRLAREGRSSPRRREANLRLFEEAVASLELHEDRDDVLDVARRLSEFEEAAMRRRAKARAESGFDHSESRLQRIAEKLLDERPEERQRRPVDLDRIEERLERLLDAIEHFPTKQKARQERELHGLRQQIDDLSRAVAIVGDRAAKHSIEPALLDLLTRIEASRAEGLREETLAPVMNALVEIRSALERSPEASARAMRGEIEELHRRMDGLGRNADTEALVALRGQVETMAHHVAEVIERLSSQEALHHNILLLIERVEDMAAAPRELAERLFDVTTDLRLCIEQLNASPAFRALEQRIEDTQGLEVAATLAEVRASIDNLAEHPSLMSMQQQLATLTEITGELPAHLTNALEGLRQAIERMASNPALFPDPNPRLPGNVAESLSEIRLSVERLAANAGLRLAEEHSARLQNIEERVTEISQKLATPEVIERLAGMQDELLSRMDRLRHELPVDQIAALRARVEEVHRAVSQTQPAAAPTEKLEGLVHQLASKLERAASPLAHDPRALQAIENQVQRIAEKLDRHGETVEAIGSLERTVSELSTQVDEARLASAQPLDSERDRATRATLEAVHETLEKVVDRLAHLEGDVGTLRSKDSKEPSRAAAPVAATEASAPAVAAPREDAGKSAAPEVHVEPGAQLVPPGRQDMALELSEPRAAQKSFIAAARRATQLMGGPPAPPARSDDDEIGHVRARARAAAAAAAESVSGASRKVVISVAGVALALGAAYQLTQEKPQPPAPEPPRTETTAQPVETAPAPASPATASLPETDPIPVGSIARNDLALSLLKDMAKNGNAAAQFELASRLLEGRGLNRDPLQAAQWFLKSAEQNYAPAQYRLGALYERGTGVERSARNAMAWYSRAAQAGHVRAMHNFGVLLADGVETKPDYAAAAAMFRRAGEHGLRDSQYNLAVLYVRGLGVEANLVEAYKWFSLAGAQGDIDALGKRDEIGQRLQPRQLTEARKAAESFALHAPDPAANEPVSFDTLVAGPRASVPADPASATTRVKGGEQVTSMR